MNSPNKNFKLGLYNFQENKKSSPTLKNTKGNMSFIEMFLSILVKLNVVLLYQKYISKIVISKSICGLF